MFPRDEQTDLGTPFYSWIKQIYRFCVLYFWLVLFVFFVDMRWSLWLSDRLDMWIFLFLVLGVSCWLIIMGDIMLVVCDGDMCR